MSMKGPATSGKPHNYKAHFTRTRSKYENVMERELQKHATDVMSKQQNLQDEVDFLLDVILDVQAKAERGELVVLPASVRPKATEPEEALDDTSRSPRSGPVLAAATEYSDEEDVPDLTVDIAIEEDVRSSDEALEETSSAPSTAGVAKRPRNPTPQGEEINVTEPAADARPGSPKRPRLS